MLMMLGGTMFEVMPFNTHEHAQSSETGFAEKAVMGRRPPLEFVGEGPETRTLQCKLFPEKFGGLSDLAGLEGQQLAGYPLPLMRGDGTPLGWYVIDRINVRSSHLDPHGVGRVVDVDIGLKRSDPPGGGGLFAVVSGLLSLF